MLEAACGYTGEARYVAFYWIPGGDELVWNTGWSSATGEWMAWLTWTRHRRVAPLLAPYDFGSSDGEAHHWLLLDRESRACQVGTPEAVYAFLRTHNPLPAGPALLPPTRTPSAACTKPLSPSLTPSQWRISSRS
jgi:hypothetical protein